MQETLCSSKMLAGLVFGGLTVALGWIALRALGAARRTLALLSLTRSSRKQELSQLRAGRVLLRGELVLPGDTHPLCSPGSGTEALYARYSVERWDGTPNVTGVGGKWLCATRGEQAVDFAVSDGSCAVPVDPRGIELLGRPNIGQLEHGSVPLRYSETLLRPGDRVLISGEAQVRGGYAAQAGYRGTTLQTVITATRRTPLLIVAEPGASVRLAGRLALQLCGVLPAAGALAAAAALLLGTI